MVTRASTSVCLKLVSEQISVMIALAAVITVRPSALILRRWMKAASLLRLMPLAIE